MRLVRKKGTMRVRGGTAVDRWAGTLRGQRINRRVNDRAGIREGVSIVI